MKPLTKFVVYGGTAVALLGAPVVIGAGVSVAAGAGTLISGSLKDMLPAFLDSFEQYQEGTTPPLFGEGPSTPAPNPASPGAVPETTPASIPGS